MTAQNPQNNPSEETRKDFEMKLIAKAWTDETFRQQLLNNPKIAVEQEFGETLPEDLNVEIIQEPANTLYIVLPAMPENNDELNDEELEAVAGGLCVNLVAAYGAAPWAASKTLFGKSPGRK